MAKTWKAMMFVAVSAVLTVGCLDKEVTQTWYLEGDGTVNWTVLEKDVRSDAQAMADRQTEEGNYIAAVRAQEHPTLKGLRALSPLEIHTRILRGTAPFTVTTEAKFVSLADLGKHILARTGLNGTSVLERTVDGYEWTLTMRDPRTADASASADDDLDELGKGLDKLTIILAEGRFLAAQGFHLSGDHREATIADDERWSSSEDAGPIVLKLRWKSGR